MSRELSYAQLRAAHADLLLRKSALYPSDPGHAELQREADLCIAAIIGWHDEMGDRPACPRVGSDSVFPEERTGELVERVFARMLEVA